MAQNEVEDMQKMKREAEKAEVYINDLNDISSNGIIYAGTDAQNKPLQALVAKNRNNGYCITLVYTDTYKKQIYHFQDNSSRSFVRTCNNDIWTQWAEQVSIVETITNANGTAIKYSDGTMICTLDIRVTDQTINGQYGNTVLYTGWRKWTYPAQFIELPVVTCGMFKWRNRWKLGRCISSYN